MQTKRHEELKILRRKLADAHTTTKRDEGDIAEIQREIQGLLQKPVGWVTVERHRQIWPVVDETTTPVAIVRYIPEKDFFTLAHPETGVFTIVFCNSEHNSAGTEYKSVSIWRTEASAQEAVSEKGQPCPYSGPDKRIAKPTHESSHP